MTQQRVLQEQSSFTPSALLSLYTLDGTAIGLSTVYYFCESASNAFRPIVFNSLSYTPFPLQLTEVAADGKGSLPRPKLSVSNINGFVSALLLQNQQLVGATVKRKRVFARFIDGSNWTSYGQLLPPWVTPDVNAAYPEESWVINRKTVENPQVVQWELSSPLELQNVTLPRRQIVAGACTAWHYRQPGTCGYTGVPVTDSAGRTFTGNYGLTLTDKGVYSSSTTYAAGDYVTVFSTLTQFAGIPIVYVCVKAGTVGIMPVGNPSNWVNDACAAKSIASCRLHFPNVPLRTSAMPGTARAGWIVTH